MQECKSDDLGDVAAGHTLSVGDLRERLDLATCELFEPVPATKNRLDERLVDLRVLGVSARARKHELHLDPATP